MFYKKYFPIEKKIYQNKKMEFLIGLYSYVFFNNIVYVDDSVGCVPKHPKIYILSNFFYLQKNKKLFILPIINTNIIKPDKHYENLYLKPWSLRNILDDLFFNKNKIPNLVEQFKYISPSSEYNFYVTNLYISTKLSYLTALTSLIYNCDNMIFRKNKHTYDILELLEFCMFFNIPYKEEESTITVQLKDNKDNFLKQYETINFNEHLLNVINHKIENKNTLTEFLGGIFK